VCSKYEHLSEACRTNKTLDHTTDKFRRSLPLTGSIMKHKYPVSARVTHLRFGRIDPQSIRRDTPVEHMFDSWVVGGYIQCYERQQRHLIR
jgi:hypothetical protein